MTVGLVELSVAELRETLRTRRASAVEVLAAHVAAVRERDVRVHAFVQLADDAHAAARAADAALRDGTAGPLAGIPVAVKDLFAVRGLVRGNGSPAFAHDPPAERDAAAVARLRAAGAVVFGTTHMHELAFGPTGVNPALGTPANPWGEGRVPGGSSSGSGAAVAARLAPAALGSDTGGSIRIPASFCGVTGLKPTYGRVSRGGMTPLAWSLDHAGPIARTVEDVALLLQALAGHDPADPTSARVPVPDYTAALGRSARGLRVGVPRAFTAAPIDPEVGRAFDAALATLAAEGAVVRDVSIPSLAYAGAMLGATILAESASGLGPLLARAGDGPSVELRVYLELGKVVTARHYVAAQRLRTRLYDEVSTALATTDVLAMPATILPAPRVGELSVRLDGADVGVLDAICRTTGPFNLTGLPALALPCGTTGGGLPIGLQLVGRAFAEADVLAAGQAYQRATDWHRARPPL